MFVDIHVHARMYDAPPQFDGSRCPTPGELIAGYDAVGVERGVLHPSLSPECNVAPQSNEEILAICERYPGRFVPFCAIDPRAVANNFDAPLDYLCRYYRDRGCKGIAEVTANLPMLDPKVQNLFRAAEAAGLPLTFHLSPFAGYGYGLADDAGLPQLEISLRRFPKLGFFGHSQAFWAEIGKLHTVDDRFGYPRGPVESGRVPELMRRYENLYGDLSAGSGYNALARDRMFAARFLNEFQDRLLFGTDIASPELTTLRPLAELLLDLKRTGEISEVVFNKVARENAIRILELDR